MPATFAHVLNAMKLQFDVILSSPLKRSLQTASFIGTEMGYEQKILSTPALAPEGTLADFQKLLREYADFENVLVVGHNPNLTSFVGSLLIPATACPALSGGLVPVRLRKGSLARLNMARGPATLRVAARRPHRALALRHLNRQVAAENFAEVSRFFP